MSLYVSSIDGETEVFSILHTAKLEHHSYLLPLPKLTSSVGLLFVAA